MTDPTLDYRPRSITDLLDLASTILDGIEEYGFGDSEIPAVEK